MTQITTSHVAADRVEQILAPILDLVREGTGPEHALGIAVDAVRKDVALLLREHVGMANELLRSYEQFGIVVDVTRSLLGLSREADVVPTLVDRLRESYVDAQFLVFGLAGIGADDNVPPWLSSAVDESRQRRGVHVVDSGVVVGKEADRSAMVSDEALVAPVLAGAEYVATVVIRRTAGSGSAVLRFDSGDMMLLDALAVFCGDVIRNCRLVGELRGMSMEMVRTLVNAVDQKDPYTSGHSDRVGYYALLLAREIGYSDEQIRTLEWSALLHDVGKIGIRDAVLKKPGKLTDEEFDHIKEHPLRGFEVVRENPYMKDALDGVLHHHERYDGNGYPRGLKGEEIPLQARIIQIADIFDALTTTRSYRSAFTWRKALDILRQDAGTAVDPALCTAFVGLIMRLYERNPAAFDDVGRTDLKLNLEGRDTGPRGVVGMSESAPVAGTGA